MAINTVRDSYPYMDRRCKAVLPGSEILGFGRQVKRYNLSDEFVWLAPCPSCYSGRSPRFLGDFIGSLIKSAFSIIDNLVVAVTLVVVSFPGAFGL